MLVRSACKGDRFDLKKFTGIYELNLTRDCRDIGFRMGVKPNIKKGVTRKGFVVFYEY